MDNNCNGFADEATAIDASQWFRDQDQDGFGSQTNNVISCEALTGFIADNTIVTMDSSIFPNAPRLATVRTMIVMDWLTRVPTAQHQSVR